MNAELDKLADGLFKRITRYIGEQFAKREAALRDSLAKLVAELPKPEKGEPGKNVDVEAVSSDILARVMKTVDALPKPANGKDADPELIARLVEEAVAKIPKPKDGTSVDPEAIAAMVRTAANALPKPKDGADGPSAAEVAELVRQAVAAIKPPENGKDADPKLVAELVDKAVETAVGKLPKPKDGNDGKSVEPEAVERMVDLAVDKAVKALPKPEKGADASPEQIAAAAKRAVEAIPRPDVPALVKGAVDAAVKALPAPEKGQPGKDADPAAMRAMVEELLPALVAKVPTQKGDAGKDYDPTVLLDEVSKAVKLAIADLPKPQNGKDFDPAAMLQAIDNAVAKAVSAVKLPEPKTIDIDALEDRVFARLKRSFREPADGKSVTIDDVKPVLEGEVSRWEVDFERRAADVLDRAIARMPKPKDGTDGVDGFELDDFTLDSKDGGRILVLTLRAGDRQVVRQVRTGVVLDRGVHRSGMKANEGDAVTYAGSLWIAKRDTEESPGNKSKDWRLAIKRGRDGLDAPSLRPQDEPPRDELAAEPGQ